MSSLFAATAGYWLLGSIANWFAIPPGFASPIWPASGFAFYMCLSRGYVPLLGIFIASWYLNIGFSGASILHPSPAWITAASIATGSTMQAWLGVLLVTHFTHYPKLSLPCDNTIRLPLLAGPIACITSASIGIGSLYLSGVIHQTDILSHWLHWWVGDVMGVFIFSPLILMLSMNYHLNHPWRLLGLICGYMALISVVVFLFTHIRASEEEKSRQIFDEKISRIHSAISQQLRQSEKLAHQTGIYFESQNAVTRAQFEHVTKNTLSDALGVNDVSWWIASTQPLHKERRPTPTKTEKFYLSMRSGNQETLDQHRHAQWQNSPFPPADTKLKSVLITQTVQSLKDVKTTELIFIQPIISPRASTNGWISVSYSLNDLVEKALSANDLVSISISIEEVTANHRRNLYQHQSPGNVYRQQKQLTVADKHWMLTYRSSDHFLQAMQSSVVWITLVFGISIVATIGLFILVLIGRNNTIELEVNAKTAAMLEALNNAQKASLVKSNFLANMSHELRTPLNSIIGFTVRMLRTLDREPLVTLSTNNPTTHLNQHKKFVAALQSVERNSRHLLSLINDILDLSKVEAGKLQIHKKHQRLQPLVSDIISNLTPQAEDKHLALSLGEIPIENLFADAKLYRQILSNLISNAIKFTDKGDIRVEFTVETYQGINGLTTCVKDTGQGIDQHDLPRLFRRFEHMGESNIIDQTGSGLGLALVKEFVSLHEGDIWVVSKVNGGSTFSFWLPLQ